MEKTRIEIERECPLRVGQTISAMVAGEKGQRKHWYKIVSIHEHVIQARDLDDGTVCGFSKVDWYTGVIK